MNEIFGLHSKQRMHRFVNEAHLESATMRMAEKMTEFNIARDIERDAADKEAATAKVLGEEAQTSLLQDALAAMKALEDEADVAAKQKTVGTTEEQRDESAEQHAATLSMQEEVAEELGESALTGLEAGHVSDVAARLVVREHILHRLEKDLALETRHVLEEAANGHAVEEDVEKQKRDSELRHVSAVAGTRHRGYVVEQSTMAKDAAQNHVREGKAEAEAAVAAVTLAIENATEAAAEEATSQRWRPWGSPSTSATRSRRPSSRPTRRRRWRRSARRTTSRTPP